IDFVATLRNERVYVQVCRTLPDDSDRELGNLRAIKDSYPKYVVTLDELVAGTDDSGIRIVHLKDFLLKGNL
ncbi:MAG: ATP-binding protein, partial [Treponema sp.]|nr:ATP-binding protein [Treponema sp.]